MEGAVLMQAYLFVHFRERKTPDGEQVYFGLSRDGFHWETVNDGQPVLWSHLGEKGVRDCTIIRCHTDGKYRIFATDLSLAYNFRSKYNFHWPTVARCGSRCLSMWESTPMMSIITVLTSCFMMTVDRNGSPVYRLIISPPPDRDGAIRSMTGNI